MPRPEEVEVVAAMKAAKTADEILESLDEAEARIRQAAG